MSGVVLFGPPASGKDTITAALVRLDGRFRPVVKVKSGSGRTAGYRMVSPVTFDELLADGVLAGVSERYGNRYGVDRRDVLRMVELGHRPVIHSGRLDDLERTVEGLGGRWFAVLLWCDRDECGRRSLARSDVDTPARLAVWDTTRAELLAQPARAASLFDLAVRTDRIDPDQAARTIADAFGEAVGDATGCRRGDDAPRPKVGALLAEIG